MHSVECKMCKVYRVECGVPVGVECKVQSVECWVSGVKREVKKIKCRV